jgi:conjugative transfer signal peptidase TraF
MDQVIAVLVLTLICAGFGTGTVVALSSGWVHQSAFARLIAVGCFIAVSTTSALAAVKLGLRLNVTGSMPMGLYRIVESGPRAIHRGSVVAVCAPAAAAEVGRRRGYLSVGPCSHDSELLLKMVVGVAGDDVTLTSDAAFVNGCPLPNGRPLALDRSSRRVVHWRFGRSRVPPSKIWVYADNERSWDSRYWGPVSVQNVVAIAAPLLTAGSIGNFACDANNSSDTLEGEKARVAPCSMLTVPNARR